MEKKEETTEPAKQSSKKNKLIHFPFRRSNEKRKKGYSLVFGVVIAIVVFVAVIDLPEFLTIILRTTVTIPFLSNMDFKDKLNAFLTFLIAIFTVIGSYSAYLQIEIGKNKGKVDDARNELEKAYGLIYTILNKTIEKDANVIKINRHEKETLDKIMSRYPFMFSQNIRQYWQNNIRTLESKEAFKIDTIKYLSGSGPFGASQSYEEYQIPLEFVNIFNDEYNKKIQNYDILLGKDFDRA
jgi:hypothetical protein